MVLVFCLFCFCLVAIGLHVVAYLVNGGDVTHTGRKAQYVRNCEESRKRLNGK